MTKIELILLGESGVGKSSLLNRFGTGRFSEKNEITVGSDFHKRKLRIEGKDITLSIWDTSGQERFRCLCQSYYRRGEGVLLVYDVTRPETFLDLDTWLRDLKKRNENAEVVIAGNKNENHKETDAAAVSMVRNFATEENLEYIFTSAKTGENVEKAFIYLVRKVMFSKGILTKKPDSPNGQPTSISISDQDSVCYDKDIQTDEDIIQLGVKMKKKGCPC